MIRHRDTARAPASAERARSERGVGAVAAWIAVAAWTGLILSASGEAFAESRTTPWIASVLRLVWGELEHESLLMVSVIVRKAAHFVEYAILSLLTFRAARLTRPQGPLAAWAGIAFAVALVCAVVDETSQSAVPTRTGAPRDVVLDACAASLAVVLAGTAHRRRAAVSTGRASAARRGPRPNAL